ncbi:MAG: hypothetical protein JWO05_3292 [Gemmatimonadetes bacterium]|nr:hypothetical protein [Gemmatimonadota bacterium]
MGMQYRIDPNRRLVLARGWGVISTRDLQDFTSQLHADLRFDPDLRSLTDLRDVTDVTVTERELRATAWMPLYSAGVRRAIVASSDIAYGLSRMYAQHAKRFGGNVRVFRTMEEAEAWLEV